MGFFKQLLGICETQPPADPGCWNYQAGRLTVELARAPELASPGGAIRLEDNRLPERVLVVHGQDGGFHAFRNKCTHGGRRIDPLPGESLIRCCSVGKSTFDYNGKVLSGSAKSDLPLLPVEAGADEIVISLS